MTQLKISNPTIGADPEMFLFSVEKNKYVPVCGLVGGTKEEPLKITSLGHALQEDNVMIEYCIPPSKTADKFVEEITFVKNYINDTVLKPLGLESRCVASARFSAEDLLSEQAQLFGCSESFNAYTGEVNEVSKGDYTLRTAGGHIHIGYDNPSVKTSKDIVKAMDLFLGVPSILLDTDKDRRKMYGKAGEFRLKPYGVEFRVLSTFWTESETLMKWAFNATMKAIEYVNSGGEVTNTEDVIRAINESNKELCKEIISDYNLEETLVVN